MGQQSAPPAIADVVDMFLNLVRDVHPGADIRAGDNQVRVFVEGQLLATVWPLGMHVTVTFPEGRVSDQLAGDLDSNRMLLLRPAAGVNEDFVRTLLASL